MDIALRSFYYYQYQFFRRRIAQKATQPVREFKVVCHATTGPQGPFMAATAGPPGPFAVLQMVPPDQLWHHGWSLFATAGSPYNPTFITFY